MHLGLLLAVFTGELFLFVTHAAREQAAIYPRWNDQIQYLTESYTGYEFAREHGFAAGLWRTVVNPSAQGTLHDLGAVVAFMFVGPSRSAALALNMLALIAWQAALYFAVARRTGSRALGWAAAALPLCLRGPWQNGPGSAVDFRLDHLAMCAFGVTSAFALLTDGFRSRRWSLAFGAAVGATLLTRFLTGTYLALIFVALLLWVLCGGEKKPRVINLILAAALAAVLAAPIFWINRELIWSYYYGGHYAGFESAIRDPHLSLVQSTSFVWGKLFHLHLGGTFGRIAVLGAILMALGMRRARVPTQRGWWALGAFFTLAPALVLTVHLQKSEVVLSVIAPGVVLLVLALWMEFHRRCARWWLPPTLAVSAVAAAGWYFVSRQLHPKGDEGAQVALRNITTIGDYILGRSQIAGLKAPRVAVDYLDGSLDGQVLRVFCYERHHVWVPFEMTLPISIAEPAEGEVMERIGRSDFVILTEEGAPFYPFEKKLTAMRPQIREWCDSHLQVVDRFELIWRRVVLYQRREIPLP